MMSFIQIRFTHTLVTIVLFFVFQTHYKKILFLCCLTLGYIGDNCFLADLQLSVFILFCRLYDYGVIEFTEG